ncbi:TPA-induced transmembrane protein [Octodon degus]|uniref:TPA-induced transmembrane protein n=1 Tax=Octodon degus TaxID=10160 RepID=A0A6P6DAD0_OCTDE|nr:TPA-induced transmembrane protein [Octodon degus]
MDEARPPSSPRDELQLSELRQLQEEQTPLNGELRVLPSRAEEPSPAQVKEANPWSSCNKTVGARCKLWMVITSIFLGFIVVIIIGLCLTGVMYIDEDENDRIELSSNKTFFIMLKIPEECTIEEELPHLLTKRLKMLVIQLVIWNWKWDGKASYFENKHRNGENSTVTYHLQFGVPMEDDSFMKYMMSEELVLGILLQDFHDQSEPSCAGLGLDPESLLLYE